MRLPLIPPAELSPEQRPGRPMKSMRMSRWPSATDFDAKLATIVAGQRLPDLTRDEAIAYDIAAALTSGGVLLELTYRAAVDAFGVHGAAELCYLVGLYCLFRLPLMVLTFRCPSPR